MGGHPVSPETKKKISETAKRNKISGGYRHGAGRGKQGWFNNYWCDSTYELAFVIYCLDHDIKIVRNTDRYYYTKDGETHYYIPDFKLENGDLVEIKGYLTLDSLLKISAVKDRNIKVLFYEDLKYMILYVSEKYKLHESNLFKLYTKPFKEYKESKKVYREPNYNNRNKDKKPKPVPKQKPKQRSLIGLECVWCGKVFISKYFKKSCCIICKNRLSGIDPNSEKRNLDLILTSGVDLMKFGYNTKLCEMFPEVLTKRVILRLLRKYNIPHFERREQC